MSGTICAAAGDVDTMKCVAEISQCAIYDVNGKACLTCASGFEENNGVCDKESNAGMIAGIIIGVIAVFAIIGAIVWYFFVYKKKNV